MTFNSHLLALAIGRTAPLEYIFYNVPCKQIAMLTTD